MLVFMGRRLVLAWVVGAFATGFMACGIDESGLFVDGSADVTLNDATPLPDAPYDVVVPPGCKTLDATACVDAGIPDGWTPVGLAASNTSCPNVTYSQQQYVADLKLASGACNCGCTPSGQFSCAGTVDYGFANCDMNHTLTFDAGDEAGCFPGDGDQHIAIHPIPTPTPLGVSCDAGVIGSKAFASSPVTVCTPMCTDAGSSDYCTLGAPFMKCIISTTSTVCPAPFQPALQGATPPGQIGPSGAALVSCNACGCSAGPSGGCDASVKAYGSTDCSGSPFTNPVVIGGTCNDMGGSNGVNSYIYTPYDPQVRCAPSDGGGSVGFSAAITVCCLP